MNLKDYPRLNLKRAFWRWYLNSTDTGTSLFQKASDNLVLYTNINKTTAFYRLFETVRAKRRKVNPKVKRMTVVLYLFSKVCFDRAKKEVFEKLKYHGASQKQLLGERLIECSRGRKKEALKIWI